MSGPNDPDWYVSYKFTESGEPPIVYIGNAHYAEVLTVHVEPTYIGEGLPRSASEDWQPPVLASWLLANLNGPKGPEGPR